MTDCGNETLRDQLPLLALDALTGEAATRVRAHVADCASCAAELAVIRKAGALFAAATPRVHTEAILRALPQAPGARPALRLERGGARPPRIPRYVLAAAASLVLVATMALPTIRAVFNGEPAAVVDSGLPAASAEPVALVGGADLADLGVDELTSLLAELEQFDGTVAAEPVTMRQAVTGDLGGDL
jgi:anti-sigma factor RsiW